MEEKTALITGVTSGIGKAAAFLFAKRGMTIIAVGRNKRSVQSVVEEIKRSTGNKHVEYLIADLSSQTQIRPLAKEFKAKHSKLDVLINCAAVFTNHRLTTADGLEMMFATNYLGPFLLTNLLLEPLKSSKSSRIINVTAPSTIKPDFTDLQNKKKFSAIRAFGATKAEELLFTYELARRLKGTGVTVNAYHPGVVKGTNLMHQAPIPMKIMGGILNFFVGISPDDAAVGLHDLATSRKFDATTGQLIHNGKPIKAPFQGDLELQGKMWKISEKLT